MSEQRTAFLVAAILFAVLLTGFWFAAIHFDIPARIGGYMPTSFAAFALILAPYWFFGFGLAEWLRDRMQTTWARVFLPGILAVPYLIFSIPRGEFGWIWLGAIFAIPVLAAGLFEFASFKEMENPKFCWQDFVVLSMFFLPVEFGLLNGAFPHSGLSALPKLLLVDAALYCYLVIRNLDRVGYDFRLHLRDLAVGARECLFYTPIVLPLGLWLHFLHPHARWPAASQALGAVLITFFFVAIPEELFFRGVLQNLLEARIGHPRSLIIASILFGLSHFNKPLPFNWRYVLLGTIAGIFYGRAWRDGRRIPSSATTHTMVDVIWSLWFR